MNEIKYCVAKMNGDRICIVSPIEFIEIHQLSLYVFRTKFVNGLKHLVERFRIYYSSVTESRS